MKHFENRLTVTLFIAVLVIPLLLGLTGWGPQGQNTEERQTAVFPPFRADPATLAAWPDDFSAYFNDAFGFRNQLIRSHNWIKLRTFRQSPVEMVHIGKDGWFFYSETLKRKTPEDKTFYDRWYTRLRARRDFLAARGVPYLFVVIPDKAMIYGDHVDKPYKSQYKGDLLDRFIVEMNSRGALPLLNLTPALRAKRDLDLYFRTDSHWNFYGAYVGYRALIEAVDRRMPNWQPMPLDLEPWEKKTRKKGDQARILGFPEHISEETWLWPPLPDVAIASDLEPYSDKKIPDYKRPKRFVRKDARGRALILHDSFMTALQPYVVRDFQTSVLVWEHVDQQTFERLVERERPDIVIEEYIARFLLRPF